MSESKTFILPDGQGGGGMIPLLASLCQQRGIDPNVLLAAKNNSGFGGEGGCIAAQAVERRAVPFWLFPVRGAAGPFAA